MEKQWYISNGNKVAGPFDNTTIESLKRIEIIRPDHFLWMKGMKNWDFVANLTPEQYKKDGNAFKPLKIAALGIGVASAAGMFKQLFDNDDYYDNSSFSSNVATLAEPGATDAIFFDVSGDGIADGIGMDLNGDGFIDALGSDFNQDGILDSFAFDTNGDGLTDVFASDFDGDGNFDAISYDFDGDGDFDMTGYDFDGDGNIDYYDDSDLDDFDF